MTKKQRAEQLRKKGFSTSKIAKLLDKHVATIRNWVKHIPLTENQKKEIHRTKRVTEQLNIQLTPELCYLIGFAQTDGHLYKSPKFNKGNLSIQLKASDQDILYKLQKYIPCYSSIRFYTRNTNFKKNYEHVTLYVSNLQFRTFLNEHGIPYGKKSNIIKPQTQLPFQEDYIRGLIDGDGSLGLTGTQIPFLSFAIASKSVADFFANYVSQYTNKLKVPCFRKDNTYDITILNEEAQIIANRLYYKDCLALDRKIQKAQSIKIWIRSINHPKRTCQIKRWTTKEEMFILNHTIEESCKSLNRTTLSIKNKLFKLTR